MKSIQEETTIWEENSNYMNIYLGFPSLRLYYMIDDYMELIESGEQEMQIDER